MTVSGEPHHRAKTETDRYPPDLDFHVVAVSNHAVMTETY